jgi:hypothetical protein
MSDINCNQPNCNEPANYGQYLPQDENCGGCGQCNSCLSSAQPLPDYQDYGQENCQSQEVIPWWRGDDTPYNLARIFEPYEVEDDCHIYKLTARDTVYITDKKTGQTTIKTWVNPAGANTTQYRVLDVSQTIDQTLALPSSQPLIFQAGDNVKLDVINNTNPASKGVKISVKLPNNPIYTTVPATGISLDAANRFSINGGELKTNLGLVSYNAGQLKDANGNIISVGSGTLLGLQNVVPSITQEIEVTSSSSINTLEIGVNPDRLKTKCQLIDSIKVGNSFIIPDSTSHKIEIVADNGIVVSQGINPNQLKISFDIPALKAALGIGSTGGATPTFGTANTIPYSFARGAMLPTLPLTGGNIPNNSAAILTIPITGGTTSTIAGTINNAGSFVPTTGSIIPANATIGNQNFVLSSTATIPNPALTNIPVTIA